MKIRELLKRSGTVIGLVRDLRLLRLRLGRGAARRAINRYCRTHAIRCLHLGAGHATRSGWLGTDIQPGARGIVRLDATRQLPADDQSIDFIFCEHMIEHIPWRSALEMLRECHRTLRPGGIIRIATPDLEVLVRLYTGATGGFAAEYVKWISDNFVAGDGSYKAVFVLNNAFRCWGHQFLYDGETLTALLAQAGFLEIVRCRVHESRHSQLRGVETHGQNIGREDINAFETMVFEATRR